MQCFDNDLRIYKQKTVHRKEEIVRGFDDAFLVPVSRYTGINEEEVDACDSLRVIADSEECGPYIIIDKDGKNIFVNGHPEYDTYTLDQEYKRDIKRGLNPDIPVNYYPDDDPAEDPVKSWRCHANMLYTNWLNYYVYQQTPYEWTGMKKKKD